MISCTSAAVPKGEISRPAEFLIDPTARALGEPDGRRTRPRRASAANPRTDCWEPPVGAAWPVNHTERSIEIESNDFTA